MVRSFRRGTVTVRRLWAVLALALAVIFSASIAMTRPANNPEKPLEQLEVTLDEIVSTLDAISSTLDAFETKLDSLETKIDVLQPGPPETDIGCGTSPEECTANCRVGGVDGTCFRSGGDPAGSCGVCIAP